MIILTPAKIRQVNYKIILLKKELGVRKNLNELKS